MPTFAYTARDQAGNQMRGTLEAESNSGAVAQLREQGLWVTELRTAGAMGQRVSPGVVPATEHSLAKRLRNPVSLRDLAIFYRQLYTMLNSGMPIYQSLEMLSHPTQTPNGELRRVIAELARTTLAGGRLSETMSRFPWLFDRMQVCLVAAGEAGGLLVSVLHRLAAYLEREHEIRQEIKRKTLYPKLVIGLLLLVLPINIPLTLGGYLSGLCWIAFTLATTLIPAWFAFRLLFTSSAGRRAFDQVKLALPVFGPLIRKMAVARFARALAALYGAGVPIGTSLALAGESCGNHVLEHATLSAVPALERGMPMSGVLQATGFFPQMFLGMVSTGESSGNLDTMLDKGAEYYEEESRHAVNQLVVTLGVVALVVVAIFVAIKLISFYSGYIGGIMGPGGAGGDLGE